MWILYAFGAAFLFTICNEAIAEITNKSGPLCIFYFSVGTIISSSAFNIYQCIKNYRARGVCWCDQNLIKNEEILWKNVVGFVLYCMIYITV